MENLSKNSSVVEVLSSVQKTPEQIFAMHETWSKLNETYSSLQSPLLELQEQISVSWEPFHLQQMILGKMTRAFQTLSYHDLIGSSTEGFEEEIEPQTTIIDEKPKKTDSTDEVSISLKDTSEEFSNKYKKYFLNVLHASKFVTGEDNDATLLFADMMSEDMNSSMYILQDIFIGCLETETFDEFTASKTLMLLQEYTYDELRPFSQTMALAATTVNSIVIQSAAIGLFSHWSNDNALNLLRKIQLPNTPWLRIKYQTVQNSLENVIRKEN